MPLYVNQPLLGRTLGAPPEPQAIQDEQYLRASRHQQDLVNLWWNPWKEQGLASILAYDHLKENKRYASLEAEPALSSEFSTGGLVRETKKSRSTYSGWYSWGRRTRWSC